MFGTIPLKYVLPLLGLTVSAFIFNTSEFMPIGLLIDISQSFGMTEDQTGIMITIYAWMVALLSLPLMLVLYRIELRKLLLATLSVFALGQFLSGIAVNYPMLVAARILVACAHSVFWSIAAPMAARLVTRVHRPLALSMIITGSSVAMIFGLPLGRVIGLYAGAHDLCQHHRRRPVGSHLPVPRRSDPAQQFVLFAGRFAAALKKSPRRQRLFDFRIVCDGLFYRLQLYRTLPEAGRSVQCQRDYVDVDAPRRQRSYRQLYLLAFLQPLPLRHHPLGLYRPGVDAVPVAAGFFPVGMDAGRLPDFRLLVDPV